MKVTDYGCSSCLCDDKLLMADDCALLIRKRSACGVPRTSVSAHDFCGRRGAVLQYLDTEIEKICAGDPGVVGEHTCLCCPSPFDVRCRVQKYPGAGSTTTPSLSSSPSPSPSGEHRQAGSFGVDAFPVQQVEVLCVGAAHSGVIPAEFGSPLPRSGGLSPSSGGGDLSDCWKLDGWIVVQRRPPAGRKLSLLGDWRGEPGPSGQVGHREILKAAGHWPGGPCRFGR